ncbi:acyloxyacyl hydrolase [Altibacter sp. HG106]|uniref:acyloxyacyl hydrolase n=1 Tax=Altibacter sp. HG106 TaxID=3023937 RepID=UPI002350860F|nr:acyloxyacyl hydrolase [Altibacter sp. HG106]MDC7994390.1 acyloxyacyl hydrolase [Altibacter sp. HG106]
MAQSVLPSFWIEGQYYYGTLLRHNKDIAHLVRTHPTGLVLAYNKPTYGKKRWQQEYGYPDYGVSLVTQFSGNEVLGDTYGLYGHFNFYFFRRNLRMRIGQGVAYATNPFDLETNFKNNAYGSHLLSTTYLQLSTARFRLWNPWELQVGVGLLHYSNGNFKAPNSSMNSLIFHAALGYHKESNAEQRMDSVYEPYKEPIHMNVVLRGGSNQSDYVGLGSHPFWVVSAFADKRLSYKSSLQAGADLFVAYFLKEEIRYLHRSGLDPTLSGQEDYKRVGVFVGHELHFNALSVLSQFGYYVYYPYDFEGRTYIRAGLKYRFHPKWFGAITLKSHGAKVEGVEFGIGVRM